MRFTSRLTLAALSLAAACTCAQASDFARPLAQQNYRNEESSFTVPDVRVEVLDAQTQRTLPIFGSSVGAGFVGAQMGQAYKIRVYNRTGGRLLVVPSIDGVNAITGETGSIRQPGYVVVAYGSVTIDGWRKSRDEVAQFVFTTESDSYAARTARPGNVGVIGLALFREVVERPHDMFAMRAQPSFKGGAVPGMPGALNESDEARLGTGHGERRDSRVTEVEFKRDWRAPVQTVSLEYDSLAHLEQRGIALPLLRRPSSTPMPFPADSFVPDPPPGLVYKQLR
jgi:hypothetical protein